MTTPLPRWAVAGLLVNAQASASLQGLLVSVGAADAFIASLEGA